VVSKKYLYLNSIAVNFFYCPHKVSHVAPGEHMAPGPFHYVFFTSSCNLL
jgi:hypothetical protein